MKILVDGKLGLPAGGIANAAQKLNHTVDLWREEQKPAFDIFSEFEPEVFICAEHSLQNRAVRKNLDMRDKLKAIVITEDSPVLGFDDAVYKVGSFKAQYECDAVYVGPFEPWKMDFVVPIIKAGYKVKIFSSNEWPIPQCVGKIEIKEVPDVYVSAKVCLHLSQKPDEGFFRIIGCNGYCIPNYKERSFPRYHSYADRPEDMLVLVNDMIDNWNVYKKRGNLSHGEFIRQEYTYTKLVQKLLEGVV